MYVYYACITSRATFLKLFPNEREIEKYNTVSQTRYMLSSITRSIRTRKNYEGKNHDARLNRIRSIVVVHVRNFFFFFFFPPKISRSFYFRPVSTRFIASEIFSRNFSIHPTSRTTWVAYGKKFERRIKGTLWHTALNFFSEIFHYLDSKIPLFCLQKFKISNNPPSIFKNFTKISLST